MLTGMFKKLVPKKVLTAFEKPKPTHLLTPEELRVRLTPKYTLWYALSGRPYPGGH